MKKRILFLVFSCVFLALFFGFSSYAADYTLQDMSITIPDFLVNDSDWAAESGFDYAFSDVDINMELNVSVYDNEGFSYEGLDDENLNDYSQLLREKYETGDYSPLVNITVSSVSAESGVAGIRSDLVFEDEHYVFYWFATDKLCYDFNFYIYNSDYLGYPAQIIESLHIGEKITDVVTTEAEEVTTEVGETLPVLSDEVVEADGDGKVVNDDDRLSKILVFPLPAILFAVALIGFIVLLIKRKKKEPVNPVQTEQHKTSDNSGIYFDPKTGKYYKNVSPDEKVSPGQPIGYIYYPVQGNDNQQNNNSK